MRTPAHCRDSGPLAQSVEQKTFNLLVDGSNPSRPTNEFSNVDGANGAFFVRLEKLAGNRPASRCSTALSMVAQQPPIRHCSAVATVFYAGLTTDTRWS